MVKIYNERGAVLAGAWVTERIRPGAVYIDHGARWDPIVPGELDRGGAINTITPHNITSKNATGMVCSGFLVEVERADLEALRKAYPEAFNGRTAPMPVCAWSACWKGVSDMGKVMVIDITKCNGCHNCQIACKDEHCGNDWSPIAKPQPLTGQFWHKVIDRVRGQVPKVKVAYEHTICQHCDDAPCMTACPEKAIYKRADGAVIIDPQVCKGNHSCVESLPLRGRDVSSTRTSRSPRSARSAPICSTRAGPRPAARRPAPPGPSPSGKKRNWQN